MSNYNRSIKSIVKGIWIRFFTIIIPFTFPSQITTFLHRLRGVKIGKGSKINRSVLIDDAHPEMVEIGKKVWITAGVIILCHQRDLTYHKVGKAVMDCPIKTAKVIIRDGVHIGIGAIILPGVTIGEGAVIGAGAVVAKDVPPYSLALGIPAKVVKTYQKSHENLD
jgi:acetyltransferase-like isoleucine patch superfamily enzyme